MASAVSSSMGGTSGALLELFFRAMSSSFLKERGEGGGEEGVRRAWARALGQGVTAIKFYGGADVGMRTMLVRTTSTEIALFVVH